MRNATPGEITDWDRLLGQNSDGGHILQTRAWGEFKARWGWQPQYLVDESSEQLAVLALRRKLLSLGELWYCPKGPGITAGNQLAIVTAWAKSLDRVFALKIEPEIVAGAELSDWESSGWRKAARDVQITRATILVDLSKNEDELLASFKSKCRYNIRLAAKKGVSVREVAVNDDAVAVMFQLMAATQSRAGFTLRQKQYYEDYWRLQHASDQGRFFFAFLGDEVLAGVFVTYFGKRAWYKDGGSSRRFSEVMAPYLLQWEVMRWLKSRGVETYDLVAVPRPSELAEGHPLWGLYRFKSGFNENITEFIGTWDLPLKSRQYSAWNRVGERIAHQWTYRVHHDIFY